MNMTLRLFAFWLASMVGGLAASDLQTKAAKLTISARSALPGAELHCERPVLRALAVRENRASETVTREMPVELGKPASLSLEPGAWQVSFSAKGCWAPTKKVLIDSTRSQSLVLPVFRETAVTGTLQQPRGAALPEKLRLVFSSTFANPKAEEPNADVFCDIAKDGRFRCPLPVAQLDLRLSVEGFAPVYWWQAIPSAGSPMDLGTVALVAGSAVAGWLLTEEGKPPTPEDVTLSLVPLGLADSKSPGEERQQQFSKSETKPLANGFFQFQSLKAGSFMLTVTGKKFAQVRLPVDLVAGRESVLYDPVLLLPPLVATFSVSPPSDFEGGNWRILLKRLHESGSYADDVVDDQVPLDGWYEAKGLNPGLHLMQILSPRGDGVWARQVNLGEEAMPVLVEIGGVRVEGEMTLGKKPLAGTIWFGGEAGAEKVTVETAADGSYKATLPKGGEWVVEVSATSPKVKQRFRKVEIQESNNGRPVEVNFRLPATRLRGVVREADGSPVRSWTRVFAVSGRPGRHPGQQPDQNGRFDFHGLDEGPVRLLARRDGASSRAIEVLLAEGLEQDVTLTLEATQRLKGQVLGTSGGIPGAFVQVQPVDNPWAIVLAATCDGAGRFEIEVPGGTREVYATVSSPGGTMGAFRTPTPKDQEITIQLPADGGTLLVELPKEGIEWDGATTPIFFRDGIPYSAREVEVWAGRFKRNVGRPGFLVAPNLVAGHYEACHVAIEDYGATILGQLARRNCVAGHLSPLGELTLKLPSVRKK